VNACTLRLDRVSRCDLPDDARRRHAVVTGPVDAGRQGLSHGRSGGDPQERKNHEEHRRVTSARRDGRDGHTGMTRRRCVRFESAGPFVPQHAPAPQAGVQPHQVLKAPDLLCSIADSVVHLVAVSWAGRISGLSSGILDLSNMEAVKMTLDLEPISVGT